VCSDAEAFLAEEAEKKKNRPALKLDDAWPKDLPMRVDANGVSWADFRPEKSVFTLVSCRGIQRSVAAARGCSCFLFAIFLY
jgi:hypothetical protein